MSDRSRAPRAVVHRPRRAVLLVALAALWLCWGTSFPAMRIMVAALPPLLATGTIFLTAGLVLAATSVRRLRGVTFVQVVPPAGTGLCLLGAQGVVAVAMRHVDVSTAALLVAAIPLWVVALGVAVGDRPEEPPCCASRSASPASPPF